MCETETAFWTLVVLTLTLGVVSVYTYLTHKLHKAATAQTFELVKQRSLSVLPSLIHEIERDGYQGKSKLIIRNIGNGAAVNVRLDRIALPADPHSFYQAEQVGTIQAGEAKEVTGKMFIKDEEFDNSFSLVLHEKEESDATYNIRFRFQDIEGRQYIQTNKIINGAYHHGKVEEET